jgi:hypothetical protein
MTYKMEPTKATSGEMKHGLIIPPQIIFMPQVIEDQEHIVGWTKGEVGWIGIVERPDPLTFLVKEVHVPEQEANAGTCELTEEGIEKTAIALAKQRPEEDILNKIRMWGHSHHNMGSVSPSSQDEKMYEEMAKNCNDFFIRVIMAKNGLMKVDLAILDMNITIQNVSWAIQRPNVTDTKATWENIIKENVKDFAKAKQATPYYGWNNYESHKYNIKNDFQHICKKWPNIPIKCIGKSNVEKKTAQQYCQHKKCANYIKVSERYPTQNNGYYGYAMRNAAKDCGCSATRLEREECLKTLNATNKGLSPNSPQHYTPLEWCRECMDKKFWEDGETDTQLDDKDFFEYITHTDVDYCLAPEETTRECIKQMNTINLKRWEKGHKTFSAPLWCIGGGCQMVQKGEKELWSISNDRIKELKKELHNATT